MKFLENIVKNLKPKFEEGGKLNKYLSVYDSLETFLFTPDHTTKSGSHIRDGIDLKRTMMMVIMAMIPALIFGMWNIGHFHYLSTGESMDLMGKFLYGAFKVIPMIAVSYGVGLGVEFIFAFKAKHGLHEGYLVSGMLIPLCMPPEIPLWMLAIAIVFAVLVGKEVFGGTGMNIMNIALLARA
ncbi:MAG: Na+-transporting NADH:ubiquinone oxidoreductase subunit B, partial [Patiriisocius sp.]